MQATPYRLRDGAWGARVTWDEDELGATVGRTVRVLTRSGKEWDAIITRIVWRSDEDRVALAVTRSLDRGRRRSGGGYRRRGRGWVDESGVQVACGYRCPVDGHVCTPDNPCHDCL